MGDGEPGTNERRGGTDRSYAGRQKKLRRKRRRNNVLAVAITACIVLASGVWIASIRFYNVSSNSMYPTLRGGPVERDRVLCWISAYYFHPPKRWETAVFQTPPNSRNVELMPGFHTGGESGITVKRLVGLGGERVWLAGGDVWTKPLAGAGDFVRQVKPEPVQREMWIGVYDEDFSDIRLVDDLSLFWQFAGDGVARLDGVNALVLDPAGGEFGMTYVPQTRAGGNGADMMRLAGVPDRYVLDQTVVFGCPNSECRTVFETRVANQKIQGRCPVCGLLSPETAVAFYEYRSGLPETGPHHAGFSPPIQGDERHFRSNSYNFVPDLRLIVEVRPLEAAAACRLALHGDGRTVEAEVGVGWTAVDDAVAEEGGLRADDWTRLEFHRVDGMVRLFVGEERTPVHESRLLPAGEPSPEAGRSASGAGLFALDGRLAVRRIALDRDVYYYGGREQGILNYLTAMTRGGEIDVGDGTFLPLGDNTTVSLDGRSWGPVPMANLRGLAVLIWRPAERRRLIVQP